MCPKKHYYLRLQAYVSKLRTSNSMVSRRCHRTAHSCIVPHKAEKLAGRGCNLFELVGTPSRDLLRQFDPNIPADGGHGVPG